MVTKYLTVTVILGGLMAGIFSLWVSQRERTCQVCYRPLHNATSYRIHLAGEETFDVCCPRCGLHFQNGREGVISAEVADFETGELLPAENAIYVVGSEVHLCCSSDTVREDRAGGQYLLSWDRCLPSVVAFRTRSRARRFQLKMGGSLSSYGKLEMQIPIRNLVSKP